MADLVRQTQTSSRAGKASVAAPGYPAVPMVERRLAITVLSGGISAERDVSLISGRAVAEALESLGHDVMLADISPDDLSALDRPMDLVFIALHGRFGEDGQLQRLLDERGIRYCGCGPGASSLAMNKVAAKRAFVEAEVPTPRFEVIGEDTRAEALRRWPAPAVVKPVDEGSSVDCAVAEDADALASLLSRVIEIHGCAMVEQFIAGPELTVGILGDLALPPIQIRTKHGIYDYNAKYLDDDTEYLFEIDLPTEVLEQIKALSLAAHRALGCRDFSRVDWMVDKATLKPYALEVNTIPGFTSHSLLPKAAARAGLDFATLCQRIVELACQRER